ncbi:MAG TPA: hypothetical protein VFA41_11685 [Ktedonobacteraceae bacterium]|jgi:uncharacterized membrane protein (DUF2068 family)|nr:hypothetical protein [Ktedonobacteraceae bacterium]
MQNVTRARPLGITIIAVILAIQGILGIIAGIMLLSAGAGVGTLGVITLILGVLYLVLAYGLWTLKTWAYWGTIILEILALLNGILGLGMHSFATGIFSLIFAIVVLIYMFADRNVRAAFRT